jgi:hypothetical protein
LWWYLWYIKKNHIPAKSLKRKLVIYTKDSSSSCVFISMEK